MKTRRQKVLLFTGVLHVSILLALLILGLTSANNPQEEKLQRPAKDTVEVNLASLTPEKKEAVKKATPPPQKEEKPKKEKKEADIKALKEKERKEREKANRIKAQKALKEKERKEREKANRIKAQKEKERKDKEKAAKIKAQKEKAAKIKAQKEKERRDRERAARIKAQKAKEEARIRSNKLIRLYKSRLKTPIKQLFDQLYIPNAEESLVDIRVTVRYDGYVTSAKRINSSGNREIDSAVDSLTRALIGRKFKAFNDDINRDEITEIFTMKVNN